MVSTTTSIVYLKRGCRRKDLYKKVSSIETPPETATSLRNGLHGIPTREICSGVNPDTPSDIHAWLEGTT